MEHKATAFILRIWWVEGKEGPPRWYGEVVHAPTRRTARFTDLETLVTFMETWTGQLGLLEKPGD